MFEWLKPKLAPGGPVELDFDVLIDRPAEEVYARIDWSDPRNCKRELGDEVTSIEGEPGQFRCIMDKIPDHVFEIKVVEEIPHALYAFTCEAVPMNGRLVKSHELYSLEPLTDSSCRVTLVMTATFTDNMRLKEFKREVLMMKLACHNALAKLRIHAEAGVKAARSMDYQSII